MRCSTVRKRPRGEAEAIARTPSAPVRREGSREEAEASRKGKEDGQEESQAASGSSSRQTKAPRSAKTEDSEKLEEPCKKEKKFAWMDSGDEDDGAVKDDEASSDESEPLPAAPAPVSAVEVQTMSQMMRFMDQFPRAKLLRLPMAECAAVCEAAARVRYYDATVFSDLIPAIRVHLRSKTPQNPAHVVAVVEGLADVNAYEFELFELAAQTVERNSSKLDRSGRRRILASFKKVNHKSKQPFCQKLAEQEGAARYEDARNSVETSWQRQGSLSSAAMPLGMGR